MSEDLTYVVSMILNKKDGTKVRRYLSKEFIDWQSTPSEAREAEIDPFSDFFEDAYHFKDADEADKHWRGIIGKLYMVLPDDQLVPVIRS